MSGYCSFHTSGPFYNLSQHVRDEVAEKKVINGFMHYKTADIGNRRIQLPFLRRNITNVKMNRRVDREQIEQFIDTYNNYPSFAIEQTKGPFLKRPISEMVDFFGNREQQISSMQEVSGLKRSFSIGQMADYKWCVDQRCQINFDYLRPGRRFLSLARRHHLIATYETSLVEYAFIRHSTDFKKNTLFPRVIQYRLCTVSASDKKQERIPILNGTVCTQSGEKVGRCIFCEKKFKTTFHLLLHLNMSYPRLLFYPVFNTIQSGRSDHVVVDICSNPSYNEIDKELERDASGTTTTYFVRRGDRKRNIKMIPMDPTLPLGSVSSPDFLAQIQGPEVLPEWPTSLRNNPYDENSSRKRPSHLFTTEEDDLLPSFGLVRSVRRREEEDDQEEDSD